ncbi:MAG TPA: tetratricopeptide repeat protein [bacterium]|nr:tetratricopeptide repeat protein [bacterium]HOL66410.1 tetratricopeptide repeat protein [bacterium]HPP11242.1 tetratricopeptide repeat protein [bacterium]
MSTDIKILTLLVAAALIPSVVMFTSSRPGQEKEAEKFFAEGNLQAAAASWEWLAAVRPSEDLYEKISVCYLCLGNKEQARKWLEKGLTKFPHCANLIFNLALLDYSERRHESALGLLNALVEKNPYFPEAYYLRGCIFEAQGRREEARKQFVEEINHNPGSKKTWQKLKELGNEKR